MNIDELIENRLFHEIHVSEIREFQKCHWAWWWKYREKLYSKVTAEPLEFGTAMHAAMEARYDPAHWDDTGLAEALAIVKFDEKNDEQFQKRKKDAGIFFDNTVVEMYEERRSLGIRMLQFYFDEISAKEKDFHPIAVEQNFIVPIPNTTPCTCEECLVKWRNYYHTNPGPDGSGGDAFYGLPVVLEGKIDLILEYGNGKVFVRDWKNIGRFSDSVEWLENDLQLNLYLWALYKLGSDIGGFEYFESKKMAPEVPEPMKRRASGRLYSVDKTKPYQYHTYLGEILQGDPEGVAAGAYENYLDWLKSDGPQFYRITTIRKTFLAMAQMENILKHIAEDITFKRTTPSMLYPSPTKFGCMYCEFRQPCIERIAGRDYSGLVDVLYDRNDKHYYEEKVNG